MYMYLFFHRQIAENKRRALKLDYKCKLHGQYRKYVDYLSGLRQWCMMVTTLMIFPLTMVLNTAQVWALISIRD